MAGEIRVNHTGQTSANMDQKTAACGVAVSAIWPGTCALDAVQA